MCRLQRPNGPVAGLIRDRSLPDDSIFSLEKRTFPEDGVGRPTPARLGESALGSPQVAGGAIHLFSNRFSVLKPRRCRTFVNRSNDLSDTIRQRSGTRRNPFGALRPVFHVGRVAERFSFCR